MSKQAIAAALAGAVAVVLILRSRMESTSSSSGTLSIGSFFGGGGSPSPAVRSMAQAIARAEGFYVSGSLPARANNPGNLKLGGAKTMNGITIFDTADLGWAALYRQLQLIVENRSAYYGLGMTLRDMGQRWTATVAEQLAWSRNVAGMLGVSIDATLREVLA